MHFPEDILPLIILGSRIFHHHHSECSAPRLDLVLILVGLLALLVIPILAAETGVSFEKLLVVRGLRLFRLVRALRWGTKKPGMMPVMFKLSFI